MHWRSRARSELIYHPSPTPHEQLKRNMRALQITSGLALGLLALSPILALMLFLKGN